MSRNPSQLSLFEQLPLDEKRCSRCGQTKPTSDFYVKSRKRLTKKREWQAWCKKCHSKAKIQWARDNPDRTKKSRDKGAEHRKWKRLEKMYGMSKEEYLSLLKKQGDCCAVCGSRSPRRNRNFHVDHCHKTGKVRGLLCNLCNLGIGWLGDSPEILARALDYLRGYANESNAANASASA